VGKKIGAIFWREKIFAPFFGRKKTLWRHFFGGKKLAPFFGGMCIFARALAAWLCVSLSQNGKFLWSALNKSIKFNACISYSYKYYYYPHLLSSGLKHAVQIRCGNLSA
jgi:hypothetical protein